jgi:hypothetical protein
MLFKSTDEIKSFLAVGAGNDFMRLKPHIQNAETSFVKPILGTELFASLEEFYLDPESLDNQQKADYTDLLAAVQRAIIHLTFWSGFQVLNATISDGGFKRTENEKVKSLFKYQEDELKEYFKQTGFNALDEVLELIESRPETFAGYMGSAQWLTHKSSFIRDTKTFHSLVFINNSRLTFIRLKPMMKLTEELSIKPVLGESLFTEIKAGLIAETVPEKVKAILPYIQNAMAYLSASMLMEETGADLTDHGLYFESRRMENNLIKNNEPASGDRVAILTRKYKSLGEIFLENLKSYLLAHPEDWGGYSATGGSFSRRNNSNKRSFWA